MHHPKEQTALIGHQSIEQSLLSLIEGNRLPSTIMLTGARGIGKATLAYRLARYLLAKPEDRGDALFGPEDLSISEHSSTNARVAASSHGDLMVLEPPIDPKTGLYQQDIKVDQARKVAHFLSLTPSESEWRVVIIDAADALNPNAANALLKVIEEPPKNALMLLVSHNPGKLLPTIRSRCRKMALTMPTHEQFEEILSLNDVIMGVGEVEALYALSLGAPGFALELIEQKALDIYEQLLAHCSPTTSVSDMLAFAASLSDKKAPISWRNLQHLYAAMLQRLTQTYYRTHEVALSSSEPERLNALRAALPVEHWLDVYERAMALFAQTEHLHLDKKQSMVQLLNEARAA